MMAEIPESVLMRSLRTEQLPSNWKDHPPPSAVVAIGMKWIEEATTAVLAVPSAVVPSELNYVINPRHPDFKKIRVGKPEMFSFDPRLWTRRR